MTMRVTKIIACYILRLFPVWLAASPDEWCLMFFEVINNFFMEVYDEL